MYNDEHIFAFSFTNVINCDILGYFLWDYDLFSKSYALVRFGISKEIGDIAGMGNNCYQRI